MNCQAPALRRTLLSIALAVPLSAGAAGGDDFNAWRAQHQQEFANYLSEQDREFSEGLRRDWEAFKPSAPVIRDETPKPAKPPTVVPSTKPLAPPPAVTPAPVVAPPPAALPKPPATSPPVAPAPVAPSPVVIAPPSPPPPPVVVAPASPKPVLKPGQREVKFDWLGSPRSVGLPAGLLVPYKGKVGNRVIADHFAALASAPYADVIDSINATRKREQLNDWMTLLLISTIAGEVHPVDTNSRRLLTWFLGMKTGLDVRLGYTGNEVLTLVATRQMLFGVSYLPLENRRYFVVDPGHLADAGRGQIYSYPADGAAASLRAVEMRLEHPLLPADARVKERKLSFSYEGKPREVTVRVPVALVPAYNQFPQMDFDVYFSTAVNPVLKQSLLDGLRPLVQGRAPRDAANLLLRFVQMSLPYQTDDQQFGYENYLFPEETLYYPYADCEDRSFLYAWLVRELLDLDVIGLNYPGHVATAVALPDAGAGETISWEGRRYTVADPTYIGADIGNSQPGMKGKPVTVIRFAVAPGRPLAR